LSGFTVKTVCFYQSSNSESVGSSEAVRERHHEVNFPPKIIGFACNWRSHGGADLAGSVDSNVRCPPGIRLIQVMCSGMVAPSYVLRAFEKGADGVLLTGCHIGDCHYCEGNYKTLKVIEKTQRIPKLLGIEDGHFRREWISASEATRLAQVMTEFAEQIQQLRRNPLAGEDSPQIGFGATTKT
jgi:coenzyme F420-reducing hydrogenase delta subunit